MSAPRFHIGIILTQADRAMLEELARTNLFLGLLLRRGVDHPAVLEWASTLEGVAPEAAWQQCPRGEWLLRMSKALSADWRDGVKAAYEAANGSTPEYVDVLYHLDGLLNYQHGYRSQADHDTVIAFVKASEAADSSGCAGAESAAFYAASAYAEAPSDLCWESASAAIYHAAYQLAVDHGAAPDEDGDLSESSPELAAARLRIANVARSVLTWRSVTACQGALLEWLGEQAAKVREQRRAA